MGTSEKDQDLVQILNPKTNRYVLVNRLKGEILEHREEPGPYQGIPVAEWRKIKDPAQPPENIAIRQACEAAQKVSASRRVREIKAGLKEEGKWFGDSTEIIRKAREEN